MTRRRVNRKTIQDAIFGKKQRYAAQSLNNESKIVDRILTKIENSAGTEVTNIDPIKIECTMAPPNNAFNNQVPEEFKFETQLFHVTLPGEPEPLFFDTLNGLDTNSDAHNSLEDWMKNTNKNNLFPAGIRLCYQKKSSLTEKVWKEVQKNTSTEEIANKKIANKEIANEEIANKEILLLRNKNYPFVLKTKFSKHPITMKPLLEYQKILGKKAYDTMNGATVPSLMRFIKFIEDYILQEQEQKQPTDDSEPRLWLDKGYSHVFFDVVYTVFEKLEREQIHEDFTSICEVVFFDIGDDCGDPRKRNNKPEKLIRKGTSGANILSTWGEFLPIDVTPNYIDKLKEQLKEIKLITNMRSNSGNHLNFGNRYKTLYHYRKHGNDIPSTERTDNSRIKYYLKHYVEEVMREGMLMTVEVKMYKDSTFVEKNYGWVDYDRVDAKKKEYFLATITGADKKTCIATAYIPEKPRNKKLKKHFNNYPILIDENPKNLATKLGLKVEGLEGLEAESTLKNVYYGTLISPQNLK